LLSGAVVLEGMGQARTSRSWGGDLYREVQAAPMKLIKVRLIPYSLWANRGAGEMSVWLSSAGSLSKLQPAEIPENVVPNP